MGCPPDEFDEDMLRRIEEEAQKRNSDSSQNSETENSDNGNE